MLEDIRVDELSHWRLVNIYLISSYLYYFKDESVITDHAFDALTVRLLNEWKQVKHPHKRLIKLADLRAGTGFSIREDQYPWGIKSAARYWLHLRDHSGNQMHK